MNINGINLKSVDSLEVVEIDTTKDGKVNQSIDPLIDPFIALLETSPAFKELYGNEQQRTLEQMRELKNECSVNLGEYEFLFSGFMTLVDRFVSSKMTSAPYLFTRSSDNFIIDSLYNAPVLRFHSFQFIVSVIACVLFIGAGLLKERLRINHY